MKKKEKAIKELEELSENNDTENVHKKADDILLRFVPKEVADAWNKLDKYYS